jgi:hypothetical protein
MTTLLNITPRDLKLMLTVASTDDMRPAICGVRVHLEGGKAQLVATDSRRLARYDWDCVDAPTDAVPFTLPPHFINLIPDSWEECHLSHDPASGEVRAWLDRTSLATDATYETGNYPKWKQVIPNPIPDTFPAERIALNMDLMGGLMALAHALTGPMRAGARIGGAGEYDPICIQARGFLGVLMSMRRIDL